MRDKPNKTCPASIVFLFPRTFSQCCSKKIWRKRVTCKKCFSPTYFQVRSYTRCAVSTLVTFLVVGIRRIETLLLCAVPPCLFVALPWSISLIDTNNFAAAKPPLYTSTVAYTVLYTVTQTWSRRKGKKNLKSNNKGKRSFPTISSSAAWKIGRNFSLEFPFPCKSLRKYWNNNVRVVELKEDDNWVPPHTHQVSAGPVPGPVSGQCTPRAVSASKGPQLIHS